MTAPAGPPRPPPYDPDESLIGYIEGGQGSSSSNGAARDWVAIILAVGITLAINLITAGVLYDAIFSASSGLSENATQILTLAFGGIIGLLGSYVGYKTGQGRPPP